jgi:uncharacterized protein (DUF1697 family)
MTRYIAFLRGINVGGHQVKMDDLRRWFEALDFGNVATFIASGNVIFEAGNTKAATLTGRIERQLREGLGYEVPTFLRSDAELARIAEHEPFPGLETADGESSYVAFLYKRPSAAAVKKVVALSNATDQVAVHDRELYWHVRGRLVDARPPGLRAGAGRRAGHRPQPQHRPPPGGEVPACSRRTYLRTLPLAFNGRASTTRTERGTL